ncbi:hypothetical protein Purlil1_12833 [Purpureocillium lilacinum]|uniref:Uncharacterized protein n=1 Tax=Purpureocillium lilacinum TaxID=33203 RepID=A0ABR0BFT9_PURLI|nr:hypothetical protein Purlil1_12833 [Purpureocillium lilacinum]
MTQGKPIESEAETVRGRCRERSATAPSATKVPAAPDPSRVLASVKSVGHTGRNAAEWRRGVPIDTNRIVRVSCHWSSCPDGTMCSSASALTAERRRVDRSGEERRVVQGEDALSMTREARRPRSAPRHRGRVKRAVSGRNDEQKILLEDAWRREGWGSEGGAGSKAVGAEKGRQRGAEKVETGGQANGGTGAFRDLGSAIPGGSNSVFQTTTEEIFILRYLRFCRVYGGDPSWWIVDSEVDASVGGGFPATPKRRVGRPTTNARDAARQFEEKELAVKRVTRQATRAVANDDGNGQTVVARTAATSSGDGKVMLQRVLELLDASRTEMKEMRQIITEEFETMMGMAVTV